MSGCNIKREIVGCIAFYRVVGRFAGACAWDLAHRIQAEPLGELALDFSQCREVVDYGVAVLANALLSIPRKRVHLEGLRQHQLRLFKYFDVDAEELLNRKSAAPQPSPDARPRVSEVA